MKLLLPLFLLLLLSACQTTTNTDVTDASNASVVDALNNEVLPDEQLQEVDIEEGLANLIDDDAPLEVQQLLPVGYDNLWLKLAEGFEFEVPDNARIAKQRDYYLRHPNYLKQVSKRAAPFLYLIVEQIEAQNLPLELALLPVVESTFDPFAYSPSNASGLWQFMPLTGTRFGLKQDWWYDGRRDIYASTGAALRYMEILHKYLGEDWLHAFAAYNSGEGRVQNAVRKNQKYNKPTDYWNLSLPKETENYVPKLLALIDLLRNHQKYGIELPFVPNKQVLTHVDTGSQLDLAYAAELAELSIAEIQLLNPAFNRWATSPDGPHRLLLPTRIAKVFSEKLSNGDNNKRIRWDRYKVRSGDSLSVIARQYGTTTNVLKQINEINGSMIKIGQPLLIPIATKSQQSYLYSQAQRFDRSQDKMSNSNSKRKLQHTIVEGDTLWDISRMYNVTAKEIAYWNQMSSKKTLRLGQQLTIWKTAKAQQKKQVTQRVTYHVRSGDSLGVIASKFNVKTADIVRWNKLNEEKYIKPGQELRVYTEKAKQEKQVTRHITYKVRTGDSLGVIAEKFSVETADLVRWNELFDKKYIHPGQNLKVYVNVLKSSS
ncbi:MAG: membrane-bound lytic murein transglycosylase D [Psychromonas sp.]|jgi:membrane-bound lytic murein transglycosylase D|uniref:LysM peptidoglycan-binding domain-containing protein n=1 Tax=Psychromonas sp. TaxID=1884585 RepID=UPI0039E24ED5